MTMKCYLYLIKSMLLIAIINTSLVGTMMDDLDVIKLDDPVNNLLDETYQYLNFFYQLRTSERNLFSSKSAVANYLRLTCSGECSIYKKLVQYDNSDFIGNFNNSCAGNLRDCSMYKEPEISAAAYKAKLGIPIVNIFTSIWASGQDQLKLEQSFCAICCCYCDNTVSNLPQNNTFCLDEISSNVADGYVVTGVRFLIKDDTVRLQIQVAKLEDDFIDSVPEWVEINKCSNLAYMNYDKRSVQIDDVILPEGIVVTGVSLNKNSSNERIYLSVYGKKSNELKNIHIKPEKFYEFSGKNRKNLISPDTDIPTACIKNTEMSKPGESYITFQVKELSNDEDEVNDNLMPYIDIREVSVAQTSPPLRGVGIYWRSNEKCGGYIAPKLFIKKDFLKKSPKSAHE